jgi:hypothetical protein
MICHHAIRLYLRASAFACKRVGMQTRIPTERLSRDEAETLRNLIEQHGEREASRMLGPISVVTLTKAAAGAAVHRLTVITIRTRLAVILVAA